MSRVFHPTSRCAYTTPCTVEQSQSARLSTSLSFNTTRRCAGVLTVCRTLSRLTANKKPPCSDAFAGSLGCLTQVNGGDKGEGTGRRAAFFPRLSPASLGIRAGIRASQARRGFKGPRHCDTHVQYAESRHNTSTSVGAVKGAEGSSFTLQLPVAVGHLLEV